jgi:hypothetical protein
MYELEPAYLEQLEIIAGEIQASEALANYLEEEEEEYYDELKEAFEPRIYAVHREVAEVRPLQLIALELVLLDDAFEGLFLPKILGYSVLRGEVNEHMHYVRPQDHFRDILLTICASANFDLLRKRIGQTIQVGFSLSSDIWVSNLIQEVDNKRVRNFLQSLRKDDLRRLQHRRDLYQRYQRQFRDEIYQSAEFPTTPSEAAVLFNELKAFLLFRNSHDFDNSSLLEPLDQVAANESLHGTQEFQQLITIYAAFFDPTAEGKKRLKKIFNARRKATPKFAAEVLRLLLELKNNPDVHYGAEEDSRLSEIADHKIKDELSQYLELADRIHRDGYNNAEVQEEILKAYNTHPGLSDFNENIRQTIYEYFHRFISNLEPTDYPEFFEISKLYALYIKLFGNQQFNQQLKDLSMAYVRKLLKTYTDKRGKDYQDIKKFVSTSFQDFEFLTEKEVVNLFKTRRKKRKKTT